jgi:hypothetical protein
MQLLREEVPHGPVAVVHEDTGGPTGEGSLDGGVRLERHEAAEAPVFAGAAGVDRVGLVLVDHPGDPFHIHGEKDAHGQDGTRMVREG